MADRREVFAIVIAIVMVLATTPSALSAVSTNVLFRHVTAKAVEQSSPNLPILVSSTFFTADPRVCSWVEFLNVTSPGHVVNWKWLDPAGLLYSNQSATFGDPGAGKTYPSATANGCIGLSGYAAANKTGTWQVKIFLDGTLTASDTFNIVKPPWGLVAVTTTGSSYAIGMGIAVDPTTNNVYVVGDGDTGQLCVTVGTQTACQRGAYLRAYDGKNLSQILKSLSVTLVGGVFVGNTCGPFIGWRYLRVIHNTAAGPVDAVVSDGGCIWDYSYPSNASNLISNPEQGWTDVEPAACLTYSGGCTYFDVGTASPASSGQNRLFYNPGTDICEIHAVSCLNNFGAAYKGGPFAFDSANNMIYAIGTNYNNVLVINTTSWGLAATIRLPSGLARSPQIAVNPVSNRIYITGAVGLSNPANYGLVVIDGSSNSVIAHIPDIPSDAGSQIAVDTKNNLVYTYDWPGSSTILVVDGVSNNVIAQIPAKSCNAFDGNIAVNPTLGYVYLVASGVLCQYASPVASGSAFHQVIINEVALNPPPGIGGRGKNSTQWVELYNPGPTAVDVSGWTLTPDCGSDGGQLPLSGNICGGTGISAYIPAGTTIAPKGYFVYEAPSQGGSYWLGTVNESLVLRDSSGRMVDWTSPMTDPPSVSQGIGLYGSYPANPNTWQRYPNGVDTRSANDWRLMPATKGFQNLPTTASSIQVGQQSFSVAVASNSTVSAPSFNQGQKQLSFSVTGPGGTHGFTRIGFPNSLLGGTLTVLLDGAQISPTITRNSTYTSIAITYSHSSHTITVTGETAAGVATTTSTTTISTSSTSSSTSTPFDFSISVLPSSNSIAPGGIATYTVTVSLIQGTGLPITLGMIGYNQALDFYGNATAHFDKSIGVPPFTTQMTIIASSKAPLGTFGIGVRGVGGGAGHIANMSITVGSAISPSTGQPAPSLLDTIASSPLYLVGIVLVLGGVLAGVYNRMRASRKSERLPPIGREALQPSCPNCGNSVSASTRFCENCGTKLQFMTPRSKAN